MSEFDWASKQKKSSQNSAYDFSKHQIKKESSATDTATRVGKNALIGLTNLGHNVINLPYNVANLISPDFAENIPRQADYDFAKMIGQTEKEPLDILTQGAVEYVPSLFLPATRLGKVSQTIGAIPKAGKYLKPAAELAAPQAAYTYAMELGKNPEQAGKSAAITGAMTAPFGSLAEMARAGSPLTKGIAHGTAALGGAGLGYFGAEAMGAPEYAHIPTAILSGLLTERGISPKSYASKKVFEDINPEVSKEIVEASRRLGLNYVTPAEATGTQFAGERQASIGRTPEGSKIKYEKGMERLASEERAISTFLDDLYTGEKLSPEKKALYDNVMASFIPEDMVVDMYANNKIIQKAVQNVESNPAYANALKDVPENSFQYWDQVKKSIDDMEQKARRNGKKHEASLLAETRTSLVKEMDKINPDYPRARLLAQRGIIRENIEKKFDKKELTGSNFYKNVLANKSEFKKLRESLSEFPDLQRQLDDMRTVFPRLLNVPTAKGAAALESTSMNKPRALIQSLEDLLSRTVGKKADVAAVKLMTDPNWLEALVKASGKEKGNPLVAAMIEHLGKASGQAGGALSVEK